MARSRRRSHRSKWALGLGLAMALASACRHDGPAATRAVTLHVSCAPAPDASARAVYHAYGDFEPPGGAVDGHPALVVGDALPEIDPAARALFVDATEGAVSWWGIAPLPATGGADVWLTPALTSCAAFPVSEAGAPSPRTGAVMAAVGGGRVLVVGGGTGTALPTLVVDLTTGGVRWAAPDLLHPRASATVTAFGSGALVAGGVDARAAGAPFDDAEVYDPTTGGFDQAHPIALSEPRAAQGAAVLATGETLLVGGVGADGVTPLGTMEIVDPVTRTVRAENVAPLAVPRSSPAVLRLASGEILVAGGVDAAGAPVTTLEWFSPDASASSRRSRDLVAGAARAFVALQGGGALAVVAPPAGAPLDFDDVWIIDADGGIEAGASIDSVTAPVLFGGAGGAPALWTGGRWLRWQPWSSAFGALGELDPAPASVTATAASPDPGLAMWLDGASGDVTALRFDTRGAYSPLASAVFADAASDAAPDRLVANGAVTFDPLAGLTLATGASAFVSDRTYADVAIAFDAPTGEPPVVVLRDAHGRELEVGGAACAGAFAAGNTSLQVQRRGASVGWRLASGLTGTCDATVDPSARVAVGLRGAPSGTSVARNLRLTRLGSP